MNEDCATTDDNPWGKYCLCDEPQPGAVMPTICVKCLLDIFNVDKPTDTEIEE